MPGLRFVREVQRSAAAIARSTPESLQVGDTLKIGLKANWQICKTSCLNESAEFQIDLPIKDESTINPELKALFATARESLPQALPKDTAFSAKPDASDADYVMLKISPNNRC